MNKPKYRKEVEPLMKRIAALVLAFALLLATPALADMDLTGYSIANGNVSAVNYVDIVAPYSGTLASFDLEAGDTVTEGDTLFTMLTNTLYASEDATVATVFAEPGDDAQTVASRYGAVIALEGTVTQRINASTSGAYNEEKNRTIHIGETLYFKSNNNKEGEGTVVAVSGTSYVVDITQGSFDSNATMTLYRDDSYNNKDCVGKGVVVRRDPILLAGSGRVDQVLVNAGDKVTRGQALMTFMSQDADVGASPIVTAPKSGVVASVAVSPCQQVWKGELLARIYLTDELEIVAQVDEMDMGAVRVGSSVPCTLDTDESVVFYGTVTEISSLGVTRQNAAYYAVHVAIDQSASLGASASIYLTKK